MPLDIVISIFGEFAKGLASEAGKMSARAILSRESVDSTPAQASVAEEEELLLALESLPYDPWPGVEETAEGMFRCLAAGDRDTAWTWCDPAWPTDPERGQAFHDTFNASPPLSWTILERWAPEGWTEGQALPWAALSMVVTYDNGDGTFVGLPATVVAVPLEQGWRIYSLRWESSGAQEEQSVQEDFVLTGTDMLVQCERCPNQLSIPAGDGPYRVKCPECWTPQTVNRDALHHTDLFEMFGEIFNAPSKQVIQCERCLQKLSIPVAVGRIRLKCPSCGTPQLIDT